MAIYEMRTDITPENVIEKILEDIDRNTPSNWGNGLSGEQGGGSAYNYWLSEGIQRGLSLARTIVEKNGLYAKGIDPVEYWDETFYKPRGIPNYFKEERDRQREFDKKLARREKRLAAKAAREAKNIELNEKNG